MQLEKGTIRMDIKKGQLGKWSLGKIILGPHILDIGLNSHSLHIQWGMA